MRLLMLIFVVCAIYIGYEAYTVYSATGLTPDPSNVADAIRDRSEPARSWLAGLADGGSDSLEYEVEGVVDVSPTSFAFPFRLEASDELQLTDTAPALEVPTGCESEQRGFGRSGSTITSYSYRITCGDPIFSGLQAFGDSERERLERQARILPFTVTNMSVDTFSDGLGVRLAPNRRTEVGKTYTFNVIDQNGDLRGQASVSWTQPELNVGSTKYISGGSFFFGGPGHFPLDRNERDAYWGHDLTPFFSISMKVPEFRWVSREVWEWIPRNVPIRLAEGSALSN